MEDKDKNKLYILSGIIAVTVLVMYYQLLLRPQFVRFIVNNREYYTVRARVSKAKLLIADESRIKGRYDSLKDQSESLEKRFPIEDEISSFLEGLSGIAESSGVRILKVKPLDKEHGISSGAIVKTEFYSEFPILIEASSGYHQCGAFINKLENMDRFIKIDAIDISANAQDPRHHNVKLTIITYIMH